MKRFTFFISLFLVALSAQSQTYVQGYYKSNGTYVQGYYKTESNSTTRDNYSTSGNYNPYNSSYGTTNTYESQGYSVPSTHNGNSVYTGSRGGTYYINSNVNKVYVK